jgi:hypothetical protein
VLDDINLPAVRLLRRFLDQDPRWEALAGTKKWRAWRRLGEGTLSEDWMAQVWWRTRRRRAVQLAQGAWTRARRRLQGRSRTP